ncbi:DUF2637 domain-containing protein [Actinocrispum wychmicini]|uniref:Uncharacterized protein DUF2637 n=1 Tax=Actinocrispum wychmicini TaxID=1213861 RepID=A0A4R2ILL3_9PSEU|nr:DUF2637 domain-containing protein [Actinocrispum wychmicini]TCO45864.1 uncharacterized protein DUF2637 [Actinocrispum wychmicini]
MSMVTAAATTTEGTSAMMPSSDESSARDRLRRLSSGQLAAVAVVLGMVVAGYGLAGSYVTVSELAARQGVPLADWVPAGIDGGLISVVALDLVLAWIGAPVGWLRQLVRVLSVGTVVANAAGGWPDWVAVGLHSAAPLMLLAIVEAGRTVLLRRMGGVNNTLRDSIPLVRWVLAHLVVVAANGVVAAHQLSPCGGCRVGAASGDSSTSRALRSALAAAGSGGSGVDAAYWCPRERRLCAGARSGPN